MATAGPSDQGAESPLGGSPGHDGCYGSEAEEAPEPSEAAAREPLFTTKDGRPIYAEDLEEMAARGVFTGAAGGAATSGSAFKVCVIADSGFGCVVLAVAGAKVGICFICSVKTAHKRFPKDALYDILKDAPSGKWVLCENNIEGVDIVCAAYKYNVKRVLYFCWPKGAAACVPGKPYIATFVDHAGNRAERAVARLSVLSRYFSYSNVVDVHNQQRQDILDLEYTWVTSNCWFRLFCTLLGMNVTDAYIVMQSKLHVDHPDKGIGLLRFADSLAMEMINNDEEDDTAPRSSLVIALSSSKRLVI